jgi:Exostosin family
MKIFIYRHLLNQKSLDDFNRKSSRDYNIQQHLDYLNDFVEYFKEYETENANEADYFFIPLFILAFQFAQIDPIDLINSCNHLNKGNHIILSTGDFGQRSRSATELDIPGRAYEKSYEWLDDRFNIVALESTPYLGETDQAFLPYVTREPKNPSCAYPKRYLINFAGAMGYPLLPPNHIRGEAFINALSGKFTGNPIGDFNELKGKFPHMNSYSDFMKNSMMTLCPAGYGRWTFRLIEAIQNESIPLLLSDGYVLPFSDQINWNDYIYKINEADVYSIEEIISKISIGDVYRKLENIKRDKHLFKKDNVLKLTSQELMSKIKRD